MKENLKIIAVSFLTFAVLVNIPIAYFNVDYWLNRETFGAVALTDIQGTDQLSAFPTVQNANNTILENVLNTIIGTTTISTLTTAVNLATVGTITTGTWSADTIATTKGGTGLTSYSTGDLLYASAANTLSKLAASSTGEVLTLDASGVPVWRDGTINEGNNFNWTGLHTFLNASSTLLSVTSKAYFGATATSTFNSDGTLTILGAYTLPTSDGTASSTVLSTDGSGNTSFNSLVDLGAGTFLGATTTSTTLSDSEVETTYGSGTFATIPAGSMGTNGALVVQLNISAYSDSSGNDDAILTIKLGGTEVCGNRLPGAISTSVAGTYTCFIYNDGSASSQRTFEVGDFHVSGVGPGTVIGTASATGYFSTQQTSSIDTSSELAITATLDWNSNGVGTETITVNGAKAYLLGAQ